VGASVLKLPLCVGEKMKKFLRIAVIVLTMIVLVAGCLIGYLTVDEFNPEEVEKLAIEGKGKKTVSVGEPVKIMSLNMGYGALGDNADFFMDGGKKVYTADKERVLENLDRDISIIEEIAPDILCVQELDRNSDRSYFIDESEYFKVISKADVFNGNNAFATNFKVAFVPVPIPPIGKVLAGIEVFSNYRMDSAERLRLPCPFSWPLRTFNLKRCLEVVRFPVEDSDKELVLVNLHLEAYDSGEGKIAQTRALKEVVEKEARDGNYVIVAGDFNQTFSNTDFSAYSAIGKLWQPGTIEVTDFDPDFSFYQDSSVPTCRSLDRALDTAESRDPSKFQYYVVDGFITSSNVSVQSVHTEDYNFVSSDHNPVIMEFTLR
jgi:endonuclease/exonuclease/phosphatase family metal-dependent hydrolase